MWSMRTWRAHLAVAWFLCQGNMLMCARDKKSVLNIEPWPYRCSLIFLAKIPDDGSMHSTPLTYGNFWVHLRGVPSFCTIVVVVQAIDAIFGDLSLGITEMALIVGWGEIGGVQYAYLPEYYFACGRIGRSSQVCIKKYETTHGAISLSYRALVILHAMRVSGTKMCRGIGVVLIIDLGDLVPEARMSFSFLSPIQPCHAVTKC
ncbi:hypothetical protein L3X38_010276 [Prunus dulcis]|uniref:Secreted protein n=1 Tax=Prunus dulcis TaxID=3755 RepID=A0AAD4WFW9_PRUDU|nr:hypothetical protein L3X38_010276 [Prunus dulcis]